MKISYSWLKEHLPLDLAAQDLAEHLARLGFEVPSLEKRGPGFKGVIAAEILAIDKHPNADRLSLCTVFDGAQRFSVICGAKNIAVGQKVPLARLGALLPGGREIVRAKIRGVESQGMICSTAELGLGDDHDGIWVMDPATPVGIDVAKSLGPSDDILEVEITPNRPDCLSHLGLARELSAYFRRPLSARPAPQIKLGEGECLPVEVLESQACPRYMGRVFTNLQIGPSPGWLAAKLEAVGLRPINNLVDITNFILMDIGQPLHAFDLDKIEEGKIVVRYAKAGERLKALDDKDYALDPRCLVIADGKKPLAIAGVMGGLDSSVTEKTTRAFLESAHFFPPVVRKASQTLRLRSDSSYRFERGTDIAAVAAGSLRAAELILKLCGRDPKVSRPRDAGTPAAARAPIVVTTERLNKMLGSSFPDQDVAASLKEISAGFDAAGGRIRFTPPSWRGDLETASDLAEEVGRLLGYDNIPSRASPVPMRPSQVLPAQALAERCRGRLTGLGLLEAYNYDFVSEKSLELSRIDPKGALARLANPISEDWTALRPSLLVGLLQSAAVNLNRGAQSVRLFELGKVYARTSSGLQERAHLAGILLGPATETFWKAERSAPGDFYDAKGFVQDLLSGIPGVAWDPLGENPLFHPLTSFGLGTAHGPLGAVGLLHPQTARNWELERENAAVFELDLDILAGLGPTQNRFKPYSLFPSSWRDLSIVLDKKIAYARVEEAIRGRGIPELAKTQLIDVFEGKGIPAGRRSLTVRFHFSREDRTLRDAEVSAAMEDILAALGAQLGAKLRS